MKKFLKFTIIGILVIWLVISSYFTYVLFDAVREREFYFLSPFSAITDIPISMQSVGTEISRHIGEHEAEFLERFQSLQSEELRDLLWSHYEIQSIDTSDRETGGLIGEFALLYQEWPSRLKDLAENYVRAIIIVKDLNSSAQIVRLYKDEYIILINELVLDKGPNDWLRSVEMSTLDANESQELIEVKIEKENKPVLTLENILIHELGHLYGDISGLCPISERHFDENFLPFFKNAYSFQYAQMVRKGDDLQLYDALSYYDSLQVIRIIDYAYLAQNLDKTHYPTMYGSRNQYEFFAECFYSYVHCVIQNKPYSIQIHLDGKEIEITNGITEDRLSYERSIIEAYFKD